MLKPSIRKQALCSIFNNFAGTFVGKIVAVLRLLRVALAVGAKPKKIAKPVRAKLLKERSKSVFYRRF